MKYLLFLFVLFNICFTSICQNLTPGEGFVNVEGGRIWYKIVGEGSGIPLLIIHGGPGGSSCNSIPGYSVLGDERPIIFYDQLVLENLIDQLIQLFGSYHDLWMR